MKNRILNIREFCRYLNVDGLKNDELHIVNFAETENVRLISDPVTIDFYLLAIKPPIDKNLVSVQLLEDQTKSSYLYVDCPQNSLEWEISPPSSGYVIMISARHLDKFAKDYSFTHYNNHEALLLTKEEELILMGPV
ncbi:MAG: hypothetical protein QM726_03025 [Chitinophagaceae bacterium]